MLLAYRLPREPSTPRSALWRKLRRLGAVQVLDGLAALPLDARNREQLEWLADEVVEAGCFRCVEAFIGEVGFVDDLGDLPQHWIGDLVAVQERLEAAVTVVV